MEKATLIYDATCPVCTNYKRFLERRLGDRLAYEPAAEGAKDVKYRTADGQTFSGTRAVDRLLADFPEVQDLNFLLPEGLRKAGVRLPGKVPASGVKAVYKVSGVVRKAYQTVRKGCNCGGGKRK
jgi:hypothetical protein